MKDIRDTKIPISSEPSLLETCLAYLRLRCGSS